MSSCVRLLRNEVQLTAVGPTFVPFSQEDPQGASALVARQLKLGWVTPSETVARATSGRPETELSRRGPKP